MLARPIRVALFPDSLNEVNGVANTCRNFVAYARRTGSPMLLVSASDKTGITQEGSVTRLDLKRGAISFALEKDLRFDLALFRYYRRVVDALREFQSRCSPHHRPRRHWNAGRRRRPRSRHPGRGLLAYQRA